LDVTLGACNASATHAVSIFPDPLEVSSSPASIAKGRKFSIVGDRIDYLPVAPEQSRSFRLVDLKSRATPSVSTLYTVTGTDAMAAWMKHPYWCR